MTQKLIYVAGPLFNTHERWYLEQIAAALEGAGYRTFLPHRDAGVLEKITPDLRKRIFYDDLASLEVADFVVALLTGSDHDSGTSAELGYCYAKGKPCYGLTDDFRWLNNFIWGLCRDGQNIVKNVDELLALLKTREG